MQELEYMECLRMDIEKEIVEYEKNEDKVELKRIIIENLLIEDAEQLDEEIERCNLSPKSLRAKRLAFYEGNGKRFENDYETKFCIPNIEKKCNTKALEATLDLNPTAEKKLKFTRCISTTIKGKRCLKKSLLGLDVCFIHKKKPCIMCKV